MISETKPDLALLLYDGVPEGFEDDFLEAVSNAGVSIKSARSSSGPFAGLELFLPFAVMLFIGKAYFDGFISKAGQNHYELLAASTKKLWWRTFGLQWTLFGSQAKISQSSKYNIGWAVVGEVNSKLRFKLIIQLTADAAEGDDAIEAFFELIRSLHFGELRQEDFDALMTYSAVGGTVLVTFDGIDKRIVPVNWKQKT